MVPVGAAGSGECLKGPRPPGHRRRKVGTCACVPNFCSGLSVQAEQPQRVARRAGFQARAAIVLLSSSLRRRRRWLQSSGPGRGRRSSPPKRTGNSGRRRVAGEASPTTTTTKPLPPPLLQPPPTTTATTRQGAFSGGRGEGVDRRHSELGMPSGESPWPARSRRRRRYRDDYHELDRDGHDDLGDNDGDTTMGMTAITTVAPALGEPRQISSSLPRSPRTNPSTTLLGFAPACDSAHYRPCAFFVLIVELFNFVSLFVLSRLVLSAVASSVIFFCFIIVIVGCSSDPQGLHLRRQGSVRCSLLLRLVHAVCRL